jgi:TRAP-type C4-dicarboxylate transport system permease small subunit
MRLTNLISRLSDIGIALSMATLVVIMVLVTLDVVSRNLFAHSIPGAVEISELLQGAMVFLGMAATMKSGNHIAADILVEKLSPRSQAIIDLGTSFIGVIVIGFMTYALWSVASGPGAEYEVTMLLGIPTQPFWYIATFGSGLLCFELLRRLISCTTALMTDTQT